MAAVLADGEVAAFVVACCYTDLADVADVERPLFLLADAGSPTMSEHMVVALADVVGVECPGERQSTIKHRD